MASNASGTPQSMLYNARGAVPDNRDRSAEQQYSNSGNPMMPMFNTTNPTLGTQYDGLYGGQSPMLGRYTPPTLSNPGQVTGNPRWNNNPGGYAYNLPNAYGGYQGVGIYGQQNWLQDYLSSGGPRMPQFAQAPQQGVAPTSKPAQREYTQPIQPPLTQREFIPPLTQREFIPPTMPAFRQNISNPPVRPVGPGY